MNETSQWLKVMLGEIERKHQETKEAMQEAERRGENAANDRQKKPT